ncbi:uncharacterized protein V6R79_002888 [Siganus canaliculatus]
MKASDLTHTHQDPSGTWIYYEVRPQSCSGKTDQRSVISHCVPQNFDSRVNFEMILVDPPDPARSARSLTFLRSHPPCALRNFSLCRAVAYFWISHRGGAVTRGCSTFDGKQEVGQLLTLKRMTHRNTLRLLGSRRMTDSLLNELKAICRPVL